MKMEEMREYVEEAITYDANFIYECDRCGHAPKRYWIDHKESLASGIASLLGLKNSEQILEIVYECDGMTRGNKREDSEYIGSKIDEKVMGLPRKSNASDEVAQ